MMSSELASVIHCLRRLHGAKDLPPPNRISGPGRELHLSGLCTQAPAAAAPCTSTHRRPPDQTASYTRSARTSRAGTPQVAPFEHIRGLERAELAVRCVRGPQDGQTKHTPR
jgi:hypothetical protein